MQRACLQGAEPLSVCAERVEIGIHGWGLPAATAWFREVFLERRRRILVDGMDSREIGVCA